MIFFSCFLHIQPQHLCFKIFLFSRDLKTKEPSTFHPLINLFFKDSSRPEVLLHLSTIEVTIMLTQTQATSQGYVHNPLRQGQDKYNAFLPVTKWVF